MKKLYAVIILLQTAFSVAGQQRLSPPDALLEIATVEGKAAAGSVQRSMQGANAVASANFDVHYYRCAWQVDPAVRFINGTVTAYFTVTAPSGAITFDLHAALKVDSVRVRSQLLAFSHTADDALTIELPQKLVAGQADSVTIFYQGIPANEGFGSFVSSTQNGIPVMWTLSEPYGAKDWWPCKNNNDDKADSIDIVITYPAFYTSSANGLLQRQVTENGTKSDYWKHRYPIAAYLVAFALTNYATESDSAWVGNRYLPVRMYAYPANGTYFRQATQVAKRSLEKFSSLFGVYPFLNESYSQTQFGWGGGMEHQTNSFIVSNDEQLVAHELSHQWFGDKVTCKTWEDVWLNEGFAQYAQYVYTEQFNPGQVPAHLDRNRKLVTSLPGGSLKVNDTTSVARIFDSRLSYAKGACVLHMIRWRLGDSLFFNAIRQYLTDPLISYKSATTADLKRNLEKVSGQDFTAFFKNWYEGEGFPSYQLQWSANKNNWIRIQLNQTSSHPSVSFFALPVPVLFKGSGGKDTLMVLNHTRNGEVFWVNPGFLADTAVFDPEIRLLSNGNKVTRTADGELRFNEIRVYPNPVKDKLQVLLKNPTGTKIRLRLLNAALQVLYNNEWQLTGRDELFEIPASQLPAGIYWLQVEGNQVNELRKLIR